MVVVALVATRWLLGDIEVGFVVVLQCVDGFLCVVFAPDNLRYVNFPFWDLVTVRQCVVAVGCLLFFLPV